MYSEEIKSFLTFDPIHLYSSTVEREDEDWRRTSFASASVPFKSNFQELSLSTLLKMSNVSQVLNQMLGMLLSIREGQVNSASGF